MGCFFCWPTDQHPDHSTGESTTHQPSGVPSKLAEKSTVEVSIDIYIYRDGGFQLVMGGVAPWLWMVSRPEIHIVQGLFIHLGTHPPPGKSVGTSPAKLVGGLNPSEKYESQLGWLFPIYGKIKLMATKPPTSMWMSTILIPWDPNEIPMRSQWDPNEIPMRSQWQFYQPKIWII